MVKISVCGPINLVKSQNGEYRADLGEKFKCKYFTVDIPVNYSDIPDNYEELEKILQKRDICEIIQEAKIIYVYNFGIKKVENIDISAFEINNNYNTSFQSWFKFKIEDNSILPYKKAFLVIKSGHEFEFKVFM